MKYVEEFPHEIEVRDPLFITLSDGVKLAARVWLPKDADENPVPAILEYLPYRRQDGTAVRDALTHPYFAGHGYASVRVDLRGSGDSEGIMLGEYLKQEQDDALEVIEWLTAQPWCSGNVGIIGISWGGFNGLQIAARKPKALKAIVTIASTDDRYADDVHYMGGCMLFENVTWNSAMFSINTTPPDPNVVGNKWQEIWLDRLKGSGFWLEDWVKHQTRDEFWQHGSVRDNYRDIEAAVYAVGGWADGYTNAVFRLLAGLDAPCKGLVGPWAHKYPHFAEPGPAIGFLQECIKWWDHWLKGIDTGIMDEPQLRAWLEYPVEPSSYYAERPGRWVGEDSWPSARITPDVRHLNVHGLDKSPGEQTALPISSPLTIGMMAGQWCSHGATPDMAGDQRLEAGGSLVFDSEPLAEDLEILGAPVVTLEVASDRPSALVAAVLSEIMPGGGAARVTYGLLNLTHRDSHEFPEALEPGKPYKVDIQLNDCGHRFGAGNRIRIALSNNYWPTVWPSPEKTMLTVTSGVSTLSLPSRPPRDTDAELRAFEEPEAAMPLDMTASVEPVFQWSFDHNMSTGIVTQHLWIDEGAAVYNEHEGWTAHETHDEYMSIHPNDPNSSKIDVTWTEYFARGAWQVSSKTHTVVTSTPTHFVVVGELEARQGDEIIHTQRWSKDIPRNLV